MATGYRVDPEGVNAVIAAAVESARPIERAAAGVQRDAASAASGSSSALVGGALQEALQTLGVQLQQVRARVPAVLHGAGEAGQAVLQGDAEMAEQIAGLATGALNETDVLRRLAHRGVPR